ncbi:hypothetical protein CORC01_03617, partial [Colletotrichum orchidophilum]
QVRLRHYILHVEPAHARSTASLSACFPSRTGSCIQITSDMAGPFFSFSFFFLLFLFFSLRQICNQASHRR